ncbi:MAG: hypothetical protein QGD91_12455, partial [Actinomycetota bacterium]|nr:hypothetical protein [Actinomycetota bacterium]
SIRLTNMTRRTLPRSVSQNPVIGPVGVFGGGRVCRQAGGVTCFWIDATDSGGNPATLWDGWVLWRQM